VVLLTSPDNPVNIRALKYCVICVPTGSDAGSFAG
jgi:hypothetical protein